jgi:hypothetical protein
MPDMELQNLIFCLLGLGLALFRFLPVSLILLLFAIGIFSLVISWKYEMCFLNFVKKPTSQEFALSLGGDFELKHLSKAKTVKTLQTLGLNAFCIVRQT